MRKSWRPTWKKPKKDSPEAVPSPRNPITKSFAALRKSVPDSPAAPLSDAKTPLRSSTGIPVFMLSLQASLKGLGRSTWVLVLKMSCPGSDSL